MSAKQLDPLDLYDIRSELSEDEVMVKETVGRFVDDRTVDSHIRSVRAKLSADLIRTVHGVGYALENATAGQR